jgi:hypothetical protein
MVFLLLTPRIFLYVLILFTLKGFCLYSSESTFYKEINGIDSKKKCFELLGNKNNYFHINTRRNACTAFCLVSLLGFASSFSQNNLRCTNNRFFVTSIEKETSSRFFAGFSRNTFDNRNFRLHKYCGDNPTDGHDDIPLVRIQDVGTRANGELIRIKGWVENIRDLPKRTFVVLRNSVGWRAKNALFNLPL